MLASQPPAQPMRGFTPSCIVAIRQSQQSSTPNTAQPNPQLKLWERIVAQLPPKDIETEWYSLTEIAPLLGIKPRSLAKHCRDLWPKWEGHYRLNYSQAISLIRRVCYAGKKVPQ